MKALVITGGDAPDGRFMRGIAAGFGLVVAADSGLESALAWGIVPDWVVGDMDSLTDRRLLDRLPANRVILHPRDKDRTDTELAISLAREAGAENVALAGAGGGDMDHLLAVRALFERPDGPCEWHTARESIWMVGEGEDFRLDSCPEGTRVSVFPLACGARLMGSEGLLWPLDGLEWGPGDFGLGNRTTGQGFSVRAGAGPLLVVMGRDVGAA